MNIRRSIQIFGLLVVLGALTVGLTQVLTTKQTPAPRQLSVAGAQKALAGSPPALAALHAQAGQLLGADLASFRERIRGLVGYPIVINKWASWCGPCRYEATLLQAAGVRWGKQVAFLGLDSADEHGGALRFQQQFSLPYPSYEDPDQKLANSISAPGNFPITVFLDRQGKLAFIHQGAYRSEAELADELHRYLRI